VTELPAFNPDISHLISDLRPAGASFVILILLQRFASPFSSPSRDFLIFSNLRLRRRPMIGAIRHKVGAGRAIKILAVHRYTFSVNALTPDKSGLQVRPDSESGLEPMI
jgi:hypothetical protein